MSYFIFNGIDSRQFGITSKLALPPLPERTMKTTEIPGRYEPLNRLDIMRKNMQITLTISMPDVTKIGEVNAWLQGKGDLILSDDLTKKYHAYVNMSIMPERISRRFGSIPIVFTVEPFRYGVTNPYTSTKMDMDDNTLTGSMEITYNGTCEGEPLLYFSVSGKLRVTVNGSTEPLIITTPGEYTGIYTPSSAADGTSKSIYYYQYEPQNIYIDVAARMAYIRSSGRNKEIVVNQTSGRYPTFKPGVNTILFELVREEWQYNGKTYVSDNQKLSWFGYQKNERWY